MVKRIALAVVVAIAVALLCGFVGTLLQATDYELSQAVGNFLKNFSGLIGVLAGVWYYLTRNDTDGRI